MAGAQLVASVAPPLAAGLKLARRGAQVAKASSDLARGTKAAEHAAETADAARDVTKAANRASEAAKLAEGEKAAEILVVARKGRKLLNRVRPPQPSSAVPLREPGTRLPYALAERLAERGRELTADPNIGLHLAHSVRDMAQVDAGLLLLMASPNVRVALEQMVRYQRFWGDGERSTCVSVRDGMSVRYLVRGHAGLIQRHSDECAMAEILLGLNTLAAHSVMPRAVRFRHAAPRDRREHRALFGQGLEFRAAHTEIVFDDAALETPMRHAHAFYAEIFRQQVERTIATLPSDGTLAREVRAVARAALAAGSCNVATTARALGVTARTLQRRLKSEQTSFDALVDGLRRELALTYLDHQLGVREISDLLGYADPRAFHHAFKRWTGTSPEQARAARAGSIQRARGDRA